MILIADSGSTKTDWCLVENHQIIKSIKTKGTNPFFQSEEEIEAEISKNLLPELGTREVDSLYFYGAGCAFPEKIAVIERALKKHLIIHHNIEVCSDMVAAARALCGDSEGIVCILGTGSNSCLYDGKEIVSNVSPLGFILGDEGSGAVLGKLLVGNLLKNQMGEELKNTFLKEMNLTPQDIIEAVYRKPFPNRFLASLSPFILKHIDAAGMKEMVLQSFQSFFRRNVAQYNRKDLKVNFIGSIAYHYRSLLEEAVEKEGFIMGTIIKSPMEGLISYHK